MQHKIEEALTPLETQKACSKSIYLYLTLLGGCFLPLLTIFVLDTISFH